jgi:predicted XRE-type DNA-binding protein
MTEIDQLVLTLKRHLKAQGLGYRHLAVALGISEPSVKRMFAAQKFSIERLVEISNLLGFTLAELTQEAAVSESRLHTLSESQERELVSDEKLLLVAVCVLNQWTVADIRHAYQLTEAECIQRLVQLDRLRLIHLLPGNRVRLNLARDFDWRPNGPIRRYFRDKGLGDFLKTDFSGEDELLVFTHAMLTDAAMARMQAEIRKFRQRFAELHEESLAAPLAKRHGIGMLLAMREWELAAFTNLRTDRTPAC